MAEKCQAVNSKKTFYYLQLKIFPPSGDAVLKVYLQLHLQIFSLATMRRPKHACSTQYTLSSSAHCKTFPAPKEDQFVLCGEHPPISLRIAHIVKNEQNFAQ